MPYNPPSRTKKISNHDEILFVEDLKNKNERAFSRMYKEYSGSLLVIIKRIVQNIEEAKDVLQETFIQVLQKVGTYDMTKSRFFTWVTTIAINKSLDYLKSARLRNQKNQISVENLADHKTVMLPANSLDTDTIGMKQLCSVLSPGDKKVIDLLYYGGCTQAEAAEILQIPLGTVKSKARRAIGVFRKQFDIDHS
jgi:RNA polymerase sigma factor (sigma-70 family)